LDLSIFVRQKKGGHAPVGFRDDPNACLVGEPVSEQNSEALLQAQLVFANVVGIKIAWIERDVLNEEGQRVIAAGLERCITIAPSVRPKSNRLEV
jgi:hypothetical protein